VLAELTRVEAGWPLAASLAAAVTAQGLLAGRRRASLNEALHELRRPLQALALTAPLGARASGADLSLQAARALERLDREINGDSAPARRDAVAVEPLLEAAVRRWEGAATAAGATLRRSGPRIGVTLSGDPDGISRALDNLIVNAIEHGGPSVLVGAELAPSVLGLTVVDSGRAGSARRRSGRRWAVTGRRRRGHGLRIVSRVVAAHGGEFRLRPLEDGTEAVVELPLAGSEVAR
jgi:signal transduction histidine kinase